MMCLTCLFTSILRCSTGSRAYGDRRRAEPPRRKVGAPSMADWLIAEWTVFGIPIQNWMWVVAGAFLLYGLAIAWMRRRRPVD